MSEMTLEQAKQEMLLLVERSRRAGFMHMWGWIRAIDAHLTRAPVQVTDEDVTRACIAYNKKLGEQGEHVKPSNYATPYFMRAALESALLAQPVVDNEGFVGRAYHAEGIRLATEELLSRPTPQAAQGGEVQGDAAAVVSGSDTVLGCESRSLHWLIKDPYSIQPGTKLYTHPAERAAVPASVQRAIERCLLSEESFADLIDKENPGDNYASLLVREDIQIVRDWLSAAPTLANTSFEICANCDAPMPGGCKGIFKDEQECRLHKGNSTLAGEDNAE